MRQDNADFRLTPKGYEIGLASKKRLDRMQVKESKSDAFVQFFRDTSVKPDEANPVLESKKSSPVKQQDKMFKLFARPNITIDDVRKFESVEHYIQSNDLDTEVLEQTEIQVKYAGYIEKEKNNADKLNRLENIKIPENFDYRHCCSIRADPLHILFTFFNKRRTTGSSRGTGRCPSDDHVVRIRCDVHR